MARFTNFTPLKNLISNRAMTKSNMRTDFSQPFNATAHTSQTQDKFWKRLRMDKWSHWIYGLFFPIVMGICLYCYESETLFRIQELNLFLPDLLFYKEMATYPGGTLLWLSCFLTEFFHYPAIGTTLLVLCWIAIYFITRSAFRLSSTVWSILPVLAPAALLAGIVQMGYFTYYIKLQGYFFAGTAGFLLAMSAVWLFSRLASRQAYAGMAWMAVWTIAGYPLFGAYALAGTFYMILLCPYMPGGRYKGNVIPMLWGALLILGVPVCAWHFYAQTSISEIYTAALPSFEVFGTLYPTYRYPFYLLFALPAVCAALYNRTPKRLKGSWTAIGNVALIAASAWGLKTVWYTDTNFHKELAIMRAIDDGDWEKVLEIYLIGDEEPTRMMVMSKNLALFRLGRAGDEMFFYKEGGAHPNAPFAVNLSQAGGKYLYYHYGQENYCYRWCMEDGVSFGWKTEYLKFMTKTSLVNGDLKVAEKYINLLGKTLFHKEWAKRFAAYISHPEKMQEDKELSPILHLLPAENELNSDQNVIELFLLRAFAYSDSDDPIYQEQTLLAALQMKDIDLFWQRFFKYATLHQGNPMPRHFQEAAYLYGHLENKVDISRMPFSDEVKDSYKRFMDFSQQCQGMTEEQMAKAFYPQFGHTFYYFYFLSNGLKTY